MKSLVIFLTLFSFLSAQHARPSRHNTQRQGRERAPLQILEKEEVNRELERRGLRLIDNGDNRKTIMPIENRISQSYEQMTIGSDAAWELNIEGDIGQQYYGSTYSAEDSSGNVFMVANYGDPYQGGNFVVVKYDSQGFKLWENVYDGPISGDDACLEIAVANDQSLLIFAQMQDTDLAFKYGLVKYSAAGNLDTASFFEESDLSYDWPNYQFGPDDCLYLIDRGINASHNSGWFVNKYAIDGNLEASRFFETGYYYGGIIPPPVKFNHLGQLICHLVDYNSQDFLYLLESDLTPIWKRVFDELDYPRNLAIDDKNNMYILADYFYPTMIKVDIYGVTIWKKLSIFHQSTFWV